MLVCQTIFPVSSLNSITFLRDFAQNLYDSVINFTSHTHTQNDMTLLNSRDLSLTFRDVVINNKY